MKNDLIDLLARVKSVFERIQNYHFSNTIKPIDTVQAFFELFFELEQYQAPFAVNQSSIAKGTPKIYYVINSIYKTGKKGNPPKQKFFDIKNVEYNLYYYYRELKYSSDTGIVTMPDNFVNTYEVKIELNNLIILRTLKEFYEWLYTFSYNLLIINKLVLHISKAVIDLPKIFFTIQIKQEPVMIKNIYGYNFINSHDRHSNAKKYIQFSVV
ncbi:MAG: hypothetical protein QW255_05480 [Candidatus Bilamarchaeaceae archaeon]